jgi:hypothetical protein
VLAALNSFRDKLKSSTLDALEEGVEREGNEDVNAAEKPLGVEDAGIEVDDDQDFMSHALHFPKDDGEEKVKAKRDYEVIDTTTGGKGEGGRTGTKTGGSAQTLSTLSNLNPNYVICPGFVAMLLVPYFASSV